MTMRLLLLSNSTEHGQGYLDHAMPAVLKILGPVPRLLFVPFALRDREAYTAKVRTRFAREGIEVRALKPEGSESAVVDAAEAVFVGGGNTFRLLDTLQSTGLLEALRRRVRGGAPYLGASAGTNIAAPTIKTTNDMPIVQPNSFKALGLVAFQINPHYLDPDPSSRHMGETRAERIGEFLEENESVVVGLREGAWLRVEEGGTTLEGLRGARIFRRGRAPEEAPPGAILDGLLTG
jgi:dipeptidase E